MIRYDAHGRPTHYVIDGATYNIFQITEEEIERSSTLESDDLDRYAICLNGCYIFVNNKQGRTFDDAN